MTLLLIGIAAGVATLIGGSLALRFKDKIHLILGFSAGAVIGVAMFDLLPEALQIGQSFHTVSTITTVVVIGFIAYMMLDRILLIATSKDGGHRGHVGAGSLTVHSLLDGLGIGLAFQVSPALGAVVAIAVLVHDFSDGINTVNLSLFGTGKNHVARGWLIADALAPLVGIYLASFLRVPESILSLVIALFAGFFLYIGASELLPDSHHRYPRLWTSVMTVLGVVVIWAAIHFAG
jgi:zinc transporter ZupT